MSAIEVAEALWLLLAALGLNLAVGFGGQAMLGQGAFVAVGAYGTVLLTDRADLPLGVAAALSVALAGLLGWCVAFGSSRLRGAYLALATWALAWLVFAALTAFPGTFGGSQGLVRPTPARLVSPFLGIEVTLTPAVHVVIAAALCLGVLAATRSIASGPVGLDLAALRVGASAADSLGIPSAALRRSTLAASAGFGAMSGAGTAILLGLVAPNDVSPLLSVQLLVAVLLGGAASTFGPVVGVAALLALPQLADAVSGAAGVSVERSRGVVTAALLLAVVSFGPLLTRLRRTRRVDLAQHPEPPPPDPGDDHPRAARPGAVVLDVTGLRHAYGGLSVLDGVDLQVRAGEVHALVGPNGSGKTTMLRLLAGSLGVQEGRITVDGDDVTSLGQRARVLAGVVRTHQSTTLFPGLSVSEHLRTGARTTECSGVAWRAVLRTPSARTAAARSLRRVHMTGRLAGLDQQLGSAPERLAYGEQRLLQVARAASAEPVALLLDEPAAGMSRAEVTRLVSFVQALARNGVGVLLVEHDMRFVASVADRMTVLAGGRVLATGAPEDVRRRADVQEVYLGGTVIGPSG